MKNLILAAATFLNLNFAYAVHEDVECTLPICDVPATLEQLKAAKQAERFQFMKDLRTKYRGETNPENLRNLNMFSEDTRDLFISLNEEDWVVRESQYLKDQAVTGLIKYDKIEIGYDVNGKNNLMKYFDQISSEGAAYEALTHWAQNVDKLEEVNSVLAVTNFGEYAKNWAVKTNQEPYVAREADKIVIAGGATVSRLFPAHEGTYNIKVSCRPTPKDCGPMVKSLTSMSIFDTLGPRGLVINISDEVISAPLYVYNMALLTKAGTHIRAVSTDSTPNTRVSEINLDVDFKTGQITGVLQDFGYAGEMVIEGTPVRRVSEYFADEGPHKQFEMTEVIGRYNGTLGDIKNCSLIVNRYSSGEIIALLDIGAGSSLSFRNGAFNAKNGVLTLAGASPNMGDRKMVLAFRKDKKGRDVLKGFMMNANPRTPGAEFYKADN